MVHLDEDMVRIIMYALEITHQQNDLDDNPGVRALIMALGKAFPSVVFSYMDMPLVKATLANSLKEMNNG